ncbi:MAG: hypothetical protein EA362_09100, partial [Saprospirales bacterium]
MKFCGRSKVGANGGRLDIFRTSFNKNAGLISDTLKNHWEADLSKLSIPMRTSCLPSWPIAWWVDHLSKTLTGKKSGCLPGIFKSFALRILMLCVSFQNTVILPLQNLAKKATKRFT